MSASFSISTSIIGRQLDEASIVVAVAKSHAFRRIRD